jgi:hypothetical protein
MFGPSWEHAEGIRGVSESRDAEVEQSHQGRRHETGAVNLIHSAALAAGDPLGALNCVALRDVPPARAVKPKAVIFGGVCQNPFPNRSTSN